MKENDKKNILRATVAIVVALALIIPISTTVANDTQPGVLRNQIKKYTLMDPVKTSAKNDNILVSNSPGDDIIPGITKDASGHTVVTWTNKEEVQLWNMGIGYSSTPTDPGSWMSYVVGLMSTSMVFSSDTAYVIGPEQGDYTGLFGTHFYYDTEFYGYYQIPDITTDPSEWSFSYWSGASLNPTYNTVEDGGYYTEPYHNNRGPVSLCVYHWNDLGYDVEDCPVYYITNFGVGATMFFDAQSHLWTAPAKEPALAMLPDWFHLTWEYHNATANKDQIVWKKIDAAVEADIEFTPYQEYIVDGTNPEIAAYQVGSNYQVVVVYVSEGTVNCLYSSDDGTTWSTPVTVATGVYPSLCVIGSTLYCAYLNGGNLFVKISSDGGATWGEALQINNEPNTVSMEENAVDIHSAGIVWVDTRDGEKEIYYAALPGGAFICDAGGPYTGYVDEVIQFTGTASGGTEPYTWAWDFGDGNASTLENPTHAYAAPGTYTVILTVTDAESDIATDTTTATISVPVVLEIGTVTGGFGVKASVKNTGEAAATNVDWTITLDGKLIFIGKSSEGTEASIAAGAEADIKSSFILGIGKTNIVVSATCDEGVSAEATKTGFVLGPFVLGVK